MSGEDPTSGPGFDFSRDPFVEQELLDSISDHLEESEFERVQFDATEVFSEFGTALDNAQNTLAERDLGYEVSDLNVRLRTNVVGTEGGVKFQFPGLDEQVTPEKPSEFDFQLQPRVTREDADYREIPSVVGMRLADAKSLLGDRRFEPTVVERQPGDEPDTVREQFPSPRSLAEPETTVDLVVTTDRSDGPTEEGESSDSEGAESEPPDGTGESGDGTAEETGEEPGGEPDSEPTEATGEEVLSRQAAPRCRSGRVPPVAAGVHRGGRTAPLGDSKRDLHRLDGVRGGRGGARETDRRSRRRGFGRPQSAQRAALAPRVASVVSAHSTDDTDQLRRLVFGFCQYRKISLRFTE